MGPIVILIAGTMLALNLTPHLEKIWNRLTTTLCAKLSRASIALWDALKSCVGGGG